MDTQVIFTFYTSEEALYETSSPSPNDVAVQYPVDARTLPYLPRQGDIVSYDTAAVMRAGTVARIVFTMDPDNKETTIYVDCVVL